MNRKEAIQIATNWFEEQGWKPAPFQKQAWTAYLQGKHGLLNAPTGSGKTFGLMGGPLFCNLMMEAKGAPIKGLKAIWITPLKSLSNEIKIASERFADGLGLDLTVGVRNGDTSTNERAKQRRNFPNLLITTPESLHLLLASKDYQQKMKGLKALVVDEWHELLGSKRGVQVELATSRLLTVATDIRVWGISATIGNLEQGMQVLLGNRAGVADQAVLVRSNKKKQIDIKCLTPDSMESFPWRGHLGLHQIDQVARVIKQSVTTLVFTNTRGQCEAWFQALLEHFPEFAGGIAMHHGSIEKKIAFMG